MICKQVRNALVGSVMLLAPAVCAAAEHSVTAPVSLRLRTPISTYRTKPGTPVNASVVAPVTVDGRTVIPTGSLVRGHVTEVKRVGLGLVRESARLALEFDELELPDGRKLPLTTHLAGVDNAGERVDAKGIIRGRRATGGLPHKLGFNIFGLAVLNPVSYLPWLAVQSVVFRFPNPEVEFHSGTDLHLYADIPRALIDQSSEASAGEELSADALADLECLVAQAPYWSSARKKDMPMDIVNVMFIGSSDAVDRAFAAAGWNVSAPVSTSAVFQTMRAYAERRYYSNAPMSMQVLDGERPDMSLQKGLNTLTKRHHVRIWSRPEKWHGSPVWLSAATHDIGVKFSMRVGLDHQVSGDVDQEREKVVNDLWLTGCVDSVVRVRRGQSQRFANGKDRKRLQTDDAIAAVFLNSCLHPAPDTHSAVASLAGPGLATRWVRKVMLSSRNQFLRNNAPWYAAEAMIHGFRAVRGFRRASMPDAPPLLAAKR